jgi:hypothetical protein
MNNSNYAGTNTWKLPSMSDLLDLYNDLGLQAGDPRLEWPFFVGPFWHLQPGASIGRAYAPPRQAATARATTSGMLRRGWIGALTLMTGSREPTCLVRSSNGLFPRPTYRTK